MVAQATPPIVLVFAATDPSGGAGLQADIMTLASMGCHALSVVTGITVQDTIGVNDVLAMDSEWVMEQARGVLEDMPVTAFKIGMTGSLDNIAAIAEVVGDYPDIPLILDPVLRSGRGDDLSTEDMIDALREMIVPQTTLITPNSAEARRLAATDMDEEESLALDECAVRLRDAGCEYVLITGTHEHTPQVINTLYGPEGPISAHHWERLAGSYHGSGCTLASAITASVAHGLSIADAVKDAQAFTFESLKAAFRPGMGQFIPDRFFWARDESDEKND